MDDVYLLAYVMNMCIHLSIFRIAIMQSNDLTDVHLVLFTLVQR